MPGLGITFILSVIYIATVRKELLKGRRVVSVSKPDDTVFR